MIAVLFPCYFHVILWGMKDHNLKQLAGQIKRWGADLGFAHTAISDIDLSECEARLAQWLAKKFHGEMKYMSLHGVKRSRAGRTGARHD